jgi:hypothetical protein
MLSACEARPAGLAYGVCASRSVGVVTSARRAAYSCAGLATPICRGRRWVVSALAAGVLPFVVCYAWGVPGHQLISAMLCLSFARADQSLKGVAAIALAYVGHSIAVIALASADPERVAELLPGATDYWQKQIVWIQTGCDPEYELWAWVPAQLQLLVAAISYSYTSLGGIIFYEGFYEVDLMNFYNAQLMGVSQKEVLALATGWHLWSWLRGIGYLFITFEAVSLSLQHLTGVRLSEVRHRRYRWIIGLVFIAADGVAKLALLGPVREQLFSNLS